MKDDDTPAALRKVREIYAKAHGIDTPYAKRLREAADVIGRDLQREARMMCMGDCWNMGSCPRDPCCND